MKDRIETIIRDWLNEKFGNPDALPNLMLKGLAEEIDNHRFEIYSYVKDEYDEEDIAISAENNGMELSKEEKDYALRRYQKAQEYDSSVEYINDIMTDIKATRALSSLSPHTHGRGHDAELV